LGNAVPHLGLREFIVKGFVLEDEPLKQLLRQAARADSVRSERAALRTPEGLGTQHRAGPAGPGVLGRRPRPLLPRL